MIMVGYFISIIIYVILIIVNWKNHKEHGMAFWIANLALTTIVQLCVIGLAILFFGIIEMTNMTIGGMLSEIS